MCPTCAITYAIGPPVILAQESVNRKAHFQNGCSHDICLIHPPRCELGAQKDQHVKAPL
jgi:hypothetical protein